MYKICRYVHTLGSGMTRYVHMLSAFCSATRKFVPGYICPDYLSTGSLASVATKLDCTVCQKVFFLPGCSQRRAVVLS